MVIVITVVSLGFAGYLVFPAMDIIAQEQPEVFVTHSGAVVQTTGDVLDPVYTIQEVEFDPEKYLREFDYGEVSQLEDGTTLREFTIIAEDDKIIVRSNGAATYVAKDIPYAAWKLGVVNDPFNYAKYTTQPNGRILYETTLEETQVPKQSFAANKVITVIDNRQTNLQKIVTNLMSKFNPESSYVHLGYEAVTLSSETAKILGNKTGGKNVQMSRRKGLYINADEMIEKLEKHIFLESKGRNDDLDDASLNEISHNVAVGTIRYELIKPDLGKIITFDINTSLKLEGDTCSYIQYSCVRAARILEKFGNEPNFDVQFDQLNTEYETSLIKQIGLFEVFVNDAAKNYSPKVIAKYCYDLAVAFSSFYEHVNVLKADTPELINARLCLVLSFKLTLEKALNLIGIIAPQRM